MVFDLDINLLLQHLKDTHQTKPNVSLLLQLQKIFVLLAYSQRPVLDPSRFRLALPSQFRNNFN